jgi:DNA-binding CsgD family transcriptional regulator
MLATSEERFAEAERHLRAAVAFRPPYFTVLFWLDHPHLLLAHCYERWGRPREALETLRPVLEECERLDTPGIILKVGPVIAPLLRLAVERKVHAGFATRLLALLEGTSKGRSLQVPTTGETLTPREVEVLRLITGGASNREIADQLFITPRTVKSHITAILGKLDATSRTQAAALARELRLV